ncbi:MULTISPECIES: hypothetical protein [Lactobacillus]|jgi:hypothetical protein|uniref:hypothetical protein n=1 Tax=Lactobacillus TaxID=1578 RepID=UPI001F15B8F3|nr:hypothetical protein [Lactobacillus amylovorus]MDB6238671.1 hypothetical protein [Lactobacillus amylovorus]UIK35435.1 hypothetical protein KGE51_02000 [Lactobacillus amylovorus]
MSKSKKKKRKQVIKEIEEMNRIIEFLTDNTVYYYLDTVPKTIGREDSYYDGYQDWCDKSYLPAFAESVTRITFAMMEYNYAEVYLEPEFYPKKYSKYVGKNIRNIGFDKLEEIIKHIVLKWQGSLIIKLVDKKHREFFIQIKDEWETIFLNLRGKNLKLVKELARSEGLFLQKIKDRHWDWEDLPKSWQDKSYKKWKKFYQK